MNILPKLRKKNRRYFSENSRKRDKFVTLETHHRELKLTDYFTIFQLFSTQTLFFLCIMIQIHGKIFSPGPRIGFFCFEFYTQYNKDRKDILSSRKKWNLVLCLCVCVCVCEFGCKF